MCTEQIWGSEKVMVFIFGYLLISSNSNASDLLLVYRRVSSLRV
jgi:hypothetical protein